MGQPASRSGRLALLLLLAVAGVLSVWMRAGFAVSALRDADDDDALFLRLAHSVSQGRWLGPFDDLTLVKGPAYPLFIAAAGMLHVPLKPAEQICIVVVSAALCRWIATRDVVGRRPAASVAFACVLFVLLCFDPIVWTTSLERVVREGVYGSLSLAVVTLTLAVCFPSQPARRGGLLLSGAALGLVGGAFWLTREEGLWLLPAVVVVIGVGALAEWTTWRRIRRQAVSWVATALVCAAVTGTVAALNLHYYGAFELNEVKSPAFTHAYGALSRIKPAAWQRYIVFPKDVRTQAYAVSPAARELEPFLDAPSQQDAAILHCEESGIAPCTGFHAGWFQWVLRAAVNAAGHYGSATQSSAFYERLAHEIDAACEAHTLDCLAARNTLAPPFRWHYVTDALREAWPMAQSLATLGEREIGLRPSTATGGNLDAASDLAGPVQPSAAPVIILHGWAATPSRWPDLAVVSHRAGARFSSFVDLAPAGHVALGFPELDAAEFTIDTDCPRQDCDLILDVPGEAGSRIPIAALGKGVVSLDNQRKLFIDRVGEMSQFPFRAMMARVRLALAKALAIPYRAIRFLWPVALGGLVVAFVLDVRRAKPLPLYALALASLTAVVSRVGLLSYLDVTAIPSRNVLYLSPAMPFLITFVVTALFLGARSVVRTVRERRGACDGQLLT